MHSQSVSSACRLIVEVAHDIEDRSFWEFESLLNFGTGSELAPDLKEAQSWSLLVVGGLGL